MVNTTNYAWGIPTNNADKDTWGTKLIDFMNDADTDLKAVSDVADGAASAVAGALLKANNLSGLTNAATARTNLGLGSAATYAYTAFDAAGSASSAYGSAVAASCQRASNLSDVGNAATARTNLGVTATGSDTTYSYRANNLSDIANAATARDNLGIGSMATRAVTIQSGGSPSGGSDGDIVLIY